MHCTYLIFFVLNYTIFVCFLQIGLIISERIINMPPQISVPLYQTLSNEVRKARAKNLPFNFTHYLLISKVLMASVGKF